MATLITITGTRKPRRALIMRTIAVYLERGHTDLDIRWGENWLEVVKQGNQWYGAGWIKDISGSDIADELNQYTRDITNKQLLKDRVEKDAIGQFYDFLKDHVSISFIGGK